MQFRDHPAVQGKRDAYPVDPRKLKIDPEFNVRDMRSEDTKAHIAWLKDSISVNGVKEPLQVRLEGDDIYVVHGHCRLEATLQAIRAGAEIESVLCIPEPKGTSEAERIADIFTSNTGKPLSMIEAARVVKRLADFGWTSAQIQKRLGWRSTQTVDNHLALLATPEDVQQMVRSGEVSGTTAVAVAKKEGKGAGETLRRAKSIARQSGKKKVTAKSVKAAKGQVDLNASQINSIIAALRWIVAHDDGKFGDRCRNVLARCGLKVED